MPKNSNLHSAKRAKNDEFYTQLSDIESELYHYRDHFKGKVVLCNCDDPYESNFFRYFALNFNQLGLRELIATCYSGSPIAGTQLAVPGMGQRPKGAGSGAYVARVHDVHDATGDGGIDIRDIAALFADGTNDIRELDGDGDFRSPECLAALDEADIVVTNPPFSLWREYVAELVEHKKRFLILGSQNAITYKEIFPLIKGNELWLGFNRPAPKRFLVPDPTVAATKNIETAADGCAYASFGNILWYTNLDIPKRHEPLILCKRYAGHEDEYPMYDNYAAINVDKVRDIPEDYMGVMGVPITFLDKFCPDQFEIVNCNDFKRVEPSEIERERESSSLPIVLTGGHTSIDGKRKYARILIRRR